MSLVTVPVHGQILGPDNVTPAVGTITFRTLIELRDVVSNVVYAPMEFVATLDVNGEFTLNLPTTDNADILPLDWIYGVYINTTTWNEIVYVQLPFSPGTTEFADLTPLDHDPCSQDLTLASPVPASGGDFLPLTGGTLTGNLVINANLQVNGSGGVVYDSVSLDIGQLLAMNMSTGVVSGGTLSINANPALIDIAAMTGYIVDYDPTMPVTPTNPSLTYVSTPAFIGQPIIGNPANPLRFWLIDSSGSLIQQETIPTAAERRLNINIGTSLQFGGVNTTVIDLPTVASQPMSQYVDLANSLGAFSPFGTDNTISANGANLMIDTTGGLQFNRSFQTSNYLNPHVTSTAAQSPATFRRATATTILAAAQTTIDVANYDPGGAGVITPIGGGVNTTSIHYVFVWGFANLIDQMVVQYGQETFSSLTAAKDNIAKGVYNTNPLFFDGALAGWICATRNATDLSDPTQAIFVKAPKFPTP